jgi:hypothetical protein
MVGDRRRPSATVTNKGARPCGMRAGLEPSYRTDDPIDVGARLDEDTTRVIVVMRIAMMLGV